MAKQSFQYWLGLDMGTNSIGWSVIEQQDGEPKDFVDCGSRIFIRSVEDKTPTPKNQNRRNMRLMRRVIERRHRRKERLRNYLISKSFLPADLKGEKNPEVKLNELGDPYELRAKALDKKLTPHEFGRAILHLGTRRGFLSNRKTGFGDLLDEDEKDKDEKYSEIRRILEGEDEGAKSDDEGPVKEGIKKLRQEIKKAGKRTLGEYLATLGRKRNRGEHHDWRTDRKMYQEEFYHIFQKQSELDSDTYNDTVKKAIEIIIFKQRPLKWNKGTVGNCSLEPRYKRARTAKLKFQKFRYWQDINNLSWDDLETGEIAIRPSLKEKQLLAKALEKNKNLTWKESKTLLKLRKRTKFNLEKVEGKSRRGIKGNTTACGIREIIGDKWDSFNEEKQEQLVEDLISYESKKHLKKRLQNHWGFDLERAVKLSVLELEEGHGNLSLKAIRKILPCLEKGRVYSRESDKEKERGALQAAGYEVAKPQTDNRETLGEIPFVPNPIVTKSLYEVRRVVNAIIKEYGKPTAIRIEMARDLEANTEKYKKALERQKENTKANKEAEEQYETIRSKNPHLNLRQYISHQDKLKYRLWKESGERCAYSGKPISQTDLWTGDIEIDHILPYSRTLDNSYMNKVVCFEKQNRKKGNRTPYEAFEKTEQWETIKQISKDFPQKKKENILATEIEKDFINNQLTDARYIAKETGRYMRTLDCDVTFTKGGITSWLRRHWKLNKILGDTGKKNRNDHRHHAIDATVIALTSPSLYRKIVHLASEADDDSISPEYGLKAPEVLKDLRTKLENARDRMIVSHSTNRKITGAFHEATAYGIKTKNGKPGVVVRKDLVKMTDKNRKNILCPIIKAEFESYVNMRGSLKAAQKNLNETPFKHPKTGHIVRRARVWVTKDFSETSYWQKQDELGNRLGVMIYGNNHHVEILKNKKTGKYNSEVVTAMEAARRARTLDAITMAKNKIKKAKTDTILKEAKKELEKAEENKEPIVKIDHGEDLEFIMSLCINDMVSVEEIGKRNFYRVRKLDRGKNGECVKLFLRIHTDGTKDKEFKKLHLSEKKSLELAKAPSTLLIENKVRQESINALGRRLTNANP
ncbi:MAG: type II CRISPR RNA-guided endonuclease Cas9 [Candidatus Dadabacteria bacterium]|nr:type II CRISPR RNA-guided endonuclease Cas9 [Candidatus Dadabacteria bacterium]